jgi:hypothetical protein
LNRYTLAGLAIESDLPLPELQPRSFGEAVVRIEVRRALPTVRGLHATDMGFSAGPGTVEMDVPGVARFLVIDGSRILVQPAHQADPATIRLYLQGSVFGALFHQRGLLPLHASAVCVRNLCVAFSGDSGAGKSTLSAYLRRRGHAGMTDDVLVVQEGELDVVGQPGYPYARLCADAAHALEIDLRACSQVDAVRDKYLVGMDPDAGFCGFAKPFARLYILAEGTSEPSIARLNTLEAMAELTRNTYRAFLLEPMGLLAAHVALCAQLAQRVRVYRLSRRRDLSEMDAVVDLLETHLEDPDA